MRAYRKETERQQLLAKKAAITQSRLLFVVNALRRLLADEHFVTLLRAQAVSHVTHAACRAARFRQGLMMSTPVRIAFERRIEVLPLSRLLPLRAVPPDLKQTAKYKRIARSISEIGIIEPLVVARSADQDGQYLLLSGHLAACRVDRCRRTRSQVPYRPGR